MTTGYERDQALAAAIHAATSALNQEIRKAFEAGLEVDFSVDDHPFGEGPVRVLASVARTFDAPPPPPPPMPTARGTGRRQ